jgi:hypothetical protein
MVALGIGCRRLARGLGYVTVACLLAAVLAAPVAARARHPVHRAPGYKWNHKIPKVSPVLPGRLVKLGDGIYPLHDPARNRDRDVAPLRRGGLADAVGPGVG